jgi:4-hydroxy-tetrahydrodipicolinate reductase
VTFGATAPAVRTAHLGLGPIGLGALRSVVARPGTRVVAAIDVRPEAAGCDVGSLAGLAPLGVVVAPSFAEAGPQGTADVVVHCVGSSLARETDRLLAAVDWGAHVVSTCEELAYPWHHHPDEARRIDAAARAAGRTVLATGINPGFAMDALALCLTAVSERVDRIDIHRVVDAATRRGPLQQKVGAGITAEEFAARHAAGTIGHVGLVESVAMIAAGLGWEIDRISETLEPVLAEAPVRTEVVDVAAGRVAGIRQIAVGHDGSTERIRLHLDMYVAATDPGDVLTIDGRPPISATVGGFHGDVSTAAIVANAVTALHRLRPGLLTMLDLVPLRRG